jgi:hypothetical protein
MEFVYAIRHLIIETLWIRPYNCFIEELYNAGDLCSSFNSIAVGQMDKSRNFGRLPYIIKASKYTNEQTHWTLTP